MNENKFPNFLQALLLVVALLVLLIVSYLALFALPKIINFKMTSFYYALVFAISSLLYIPTIYFALKKSKIKICIKDIFPGFTNLAILFIISVSFYTLSLIAVGSIENLSRLINGNINMIVFDVIGINTTSIVKIAHLVILAPILEEIFFRGIILKQFLKQYSAVTSIILSSLLFVFAHLSLENLLSLIVLGVFLGIMYYKTTLVISICIHSIYNISSLFMTTHSIETGGKSFSRMLILVLVTSSIIVMGGNYLSKQYKKKEILKLPITFKDDMYSIKNRLMRYSKRN